MGRLDRAKYLLGIVFDSKGNRRAVKKTVNRRGKAHTQTYWVNQPLAEGVSVETYSPSKHGDVSHELDKSLFPDLPSDRNEFEDYKGWTLSANGKFAGMLLYTKTEEKNWSFDILGITEDQRGKKLANSLMDNLVSEADKEGATIHTRAYKGDPKLIYLYEKYGFKDTGKKNYVGSVFMVREPKTKRSS
jgi:ribosomal protein S18 acetylase RimI-like enzyme